MKPHDTIVQAILFIVVVPLEYITFRDSFVSLFGYKLTELLKMRPPIRVIYDNIYSMLFKFLETRRMSTLS